MNPCKCGHFGDPSCTCSLSSALKYQNRISGPLYDRIDLTVGVDNINPWQLNDLKPSENSKVIKERVISARLFQYERIKNIVKEYKTNASMSGEEIENTANLTDKARTLLTKSAEKFKLSVRTYYKTIKVARTIADMNFKNNIDEDDIATALNFRKK